MNADWMRTIKAVESRVGGRLFLLWSDGTAGEIGCPTAAASATAPLRLGDWGHSLVWEDGFELEADSLWLDTLDAIGRSDARCFLEWRLTNGLSLAKAAEALGLARRTVAYYSNGDRAVPKTVLLACKGWDATRPAKKAA